MYQSTSAFVLNLVLSGVINGYEADTLQKKLSGTEIKGDWYALFHRCEEIIGRPIKINNYNANRN